MDVSIVVPALNEAKNITMVINEIKNVLNEKYSFELIIVDGNSSDGTVEIVEKLNVKIIKNCTGKLETVSLFFWSILCGTQNTQTCVMVTDPLTEMLSKT